VPSRKVNALLDADSQGAQPPFVAAAAGDMAGDPRLGIMQRLQLQQCGAVSALVACIRAVQHQALAPGSDHVVEPPLQSPR
jgi:hypothetical protein